MSKVYHRYFTNNDKYGERKTPYLDSLAFVVQEFLYTEDKAKQEIKYRESVFDNYTMTTQINRKTKSFDCYMQGHIQLYDFVTMTLHLINTLPSDYAKVQLKEYLADLKKTNSIYSRNDIYYTNNDGIYLYNPSKEMIFALLWTAWIYMKVFLDLNPNKMLEKRVDMLYDAMKENYPSTAENLEKHPLIAHAPDAMTLMCQHIKAKSQKSKRSKSPEKEATEDGNAKLLARIAELEAELKKTKEENVQLKKESKEIVPANAYEKIIFFATVLSAAYDAGFTNQLELSEFICTICGGSPTTFQPRISKLSSMSATGKYEQEVIHAAQRIVERLKKVPKGGDKGNPRILDIINSIEGEFELRKYK